MSVHPHPTQPDSRTYIPRLVFWETTSACNLKCMHCRASATDTPTADDLRTDEAEAMIDSIAAAARPILVLSGGEPLVRPDIFHLARHATERGLKVALATNGTLVDDAVAHEARSSGIERASVSIDGADAETHDRFRRQPGSFVDALRGIESLKKAGIPFQINTSVANHNKHQIPDILDLAIALEACAFHLFLLVPVGCGLQIADEEMISPAEYEQMLNWFYDASRRVQIQLKATCAPHYYRILRQRSAQEGVRVTLQTHGMDAVTKGCLAGTGVCFVSHSGEVYPCGYLPVSAGNVRTASFANIWRDAEVFRQLRNEDLLQGKCGPCEFGGVCGGCRARAYAETGSFLSEEPFCVYQPKRQAKAEADT